MEQLEKLVVLLRGELQLLGKTLRAAWQGDFAGLHKAVQDLGQELRNQKPPVVNVPAPVVNVQPPEVHVTVPDVHVPKIEIPPFPPIHVPEPRVTVNVPPIEIPPIKVPTPRVTVNPPEVKVQMPSEISVPEVAGLLSQLLGLMRQGDGYSVWKDVDRDRPIPVVLIDPETNKLYRAMGGFAMTAAGGGGGGSEPASRITQGNAAITASAEILAADPLTKRVEICNNSDTDTLFLGGAGVSAANGFPLLPFASKVFETTAAIHGASSGGEINVRFIKYT